MGYVSFLLRYWQSIQALYIMQMPFISVAAIVKAEKNKSALCHATCVCRLRLKCDGTRSETRFRLSAKGRVHLNWRGRQFSRILAAEVCASAVVMLDTPCSEVVWGVLVTHSIRQFPLHFPSYASPCAITFQLDSTTMPGLGYWVLLSAFHSHYLFTSM